jgi:hypothetical protein
MELRNTTNNVSTSQRCCRWSNINSSPNESSRTFRSLEDASLRLCILVRCIPVLVDPFLEGGGLGVSKKCIIRGTHCLKDGTSKYPYYRSGTHGDISSWHLPDLELDSVRSQNILGQRVWTHFSYSWIRIHSLSVQVRNLGHLLHYNLMWQNIREMIVYRVRYLTYTCLWKSIIFQF